MSRLGLHPLLYIFIITAYLKSVSPPVLRRGGTPAGRWHGQAARSTASAFRRDFLGSPPCRAQSSSPKGPIARTHRADSSILHVLSAIFQELHNYMFISLCTLRIDKSIRNMYNKARNQRSTAEAQERANPADLKQKGARPMVDMEPAQFGQAVGIR